MTTWPTEVDLRPDRVARCQLFDSIHRFEILEETTLSWSREDRPETERLVGITRETDRLRFVPVAGSIPLLVQLDRRVICTARSEAIGRLRIPLHIQLGVGDEQSIQILDIVAPEPQSRALYGPVDAGTVCHSVRSAFLGSFEESSGDDISEELTEGDAAVTDEPEVVDETAGTQGPPARAIAAPSARLALRIVNGTVGPLEVSKIMVPLDFLSLYQEPGGELWTGRVTMELGGDREATLSDGPCPIEGAEPLGDVTGAPTRRVERPMLLFKHSYKNKTGLEYGF